MEIAQVLEKIGLSEKEALVYKALLELGRASATDIAKKARVKRPTAYLILDELRKKELVLVIPKYKKTVYVAESPKKLQNILKEKREALENVLPTLLATYNLKPEKPSIRYYEGRDQFLEIYEDILKSKEAWFFGSIKGIKETFPVYFNEWGDRAEQKGLKIKEIVGHSKDDLEYVKKYSKSAFRETRPLPINNPFSFKTDNALWENKLAIFSYEFMFAVVIESKDVVESHKALLDLAWQSVKTK